MNAQEAMDIVEQLKYMGETDRNVRTTEIEDEAISIVIESTKLLHDVLENCDDVVTKGWLKVYINESISMSTSQARKIGIEVENDTYI